MLTLRWTHGALRDVRHLHDYIAAPNPEAARQMVVRIREAASHLRHTPYTGRPGRVPQTRELPIAATPYIVTYMVEGSEVRIVAVFHGSRQWPESF